MTIPSPSWLDAKATSPSAQALSLPPGGERRTQAQTLIEISTGDDIELYHAPDGTPFADIIIAGHRETWSLKSAGFRRWLKRAYYELTGSAPNSDAMATAMGVIEAKAHYDGVERIVYLR